MKEDKHLVVAGILGRLFARFIIFAVKVYLAAILIFIVYQLWR